MRPVALRRIATLTLLACALAAGVEANGTNQREIQGRVESVDTAEGRLVVVREFRGKTVRVSLKAAPGSRVFACVGEPAGLDRVRAGMVVSAFYELVGTDGVVNLIVIEPTGKK